MEGTKDWVKNIYGILAGILGVIFLFLIFYVNILSLLNWEVGFVDPSSYFAESLIRLYNFAWFHLILVLFIVIILIARAIYLFTWKASFYKSEVFFNFMKPILRYFISLRHNLLARSKLFRSLSILNEVKTNKVRLNIWYNDRRYINWAWRRPMIEAEKFLKVSDAAEYKRLEVVWCGLPTVILLSLATPALAFIYTLDPAIDPIYTIKIIGRQWYWNYSIEAYIKVDYQSEHWKHTELSKKFNEFLAKLHVPYFLNHDILKDWEEFFYNLHTYSDYVRVTYTFDSVMTVEADLIKGTHRLLEVDNRLVLPIGVPIRFIVTSLDVIHSWAVPSLSIKVDAVPGRLNQFIVEINKPGIYFGQCSELCGPLHGFMPIVITAVPPTEFENWLLSAGKVIED